MLLWSVSFSHPQPFPITFRGLCNTRAVSNTWRITPGYVLTQPQVLLCLLAGSLPLLMLTCRTTLTTIGESQLGIVLSCPHTLPSLASTLLQPHLRSSVFLPKI